MSGVWGVFKRLIHDYGGGSGVGGETPFSTNPPISEQFFHDPPPCLNFKNKKPPPPNFRGGEETMYSFFHLNLILERQSITVRIKSKVKAFQQIKFNNNLTMIFFNSQNNVKII